MEKLRSSLSSSSLSSSRSSRSSPSSLWPSGWWCWETKRAWSNCLWSRSLSILSFSTTWSDTSLFLSSMISLSSSPHCHRHQLNAIIIQIFAIIINNIIIIHVIAIIANNIIINNIIPDESFADLWVWRVQKVQSQAGVEGAQGQAGDDKQKHDGGDDGGDAGSGHHDHRGQPQGDRHGHLRLRHPGKERCLPCESSFFCLSHTLSTGWLGLESRFQSQPK